MSNKKARLTGVFLNNFQSIKNPTFINLENLTLLYGPNSAGKSSIIDALRLIKYAAVENDTGYNIHYHFRTNSHNGETALGIEFIYGEINTHKPEIGRWAETPDSSGEHLHREFHEALIGNRIQVEFSENSESLKVAINNSPFIEITLEYIEYNEFHKIAKNEDDEKNDDSYISGNLKIHKNNKFFKKIEDRLSDLYSPINSDKSKKRLYLPHYQEHHYDLLIKEEAEQISIKGIRFSPEQYAYSSRVFTTNDLAELLFYEHQNDEEDKKLYSKEGNLFLTENFSKSSPDYQKRLSGRRSLYWKINDIAQDINLIIEGLFFQIRDAIEFSHVKGDRGLIDSARPLYVTEYKKITQSINIGIEYKHLQRYASFLSKPDKFIFPEPVIKSDFINKSLNQYLSSLRDYKIAPEVHKTVPSGELGQQESEIVYLNILNKKGVKLGFQDVGSGLSYIMPILTSLWASKFSIIEQPELHLHPKAQCELGDVFISAYSKGATALIESHSEHLLLRILRRIRETNKDYLIPKELKITPDCVSIYYFEPLPEGYTAVKKIRVDRHGELLDLWPGGFFSERDGELFS